MKRFFTTCFALLLGSTLIIPAQSQSIIVESGKGKNSYKHQESRDQLFKVEYSGDIEFFDNEMGVKSISDGGYFLIDSKNKGKSVYLEIKSTQGGSGLAHEYKVDGKTRTYDDAARRATQPLFLRMFRTTGIGADSRVASILDHSGVEGVFDELELLEGSSASRRYFTALVDQGSLTEKQLIRLARLSKDIPSSGDRTKFLIAASEHYHVSDELSKAYYEAVSSIPSSGDRTRVLLHALDNTDDHEQLARILETAKSIPSSGDKSRVLIRVASMYDNSAEHREAFFDAVVTVPSSGDRTRVLLALAKNDLDTESVSALFQTAASIPSSGDRARLLINVASKYTNNAHQREVFFDTVNSIPSSGDHARVLIRLLDEASLDSDSLLDLLQSVEEIASSGDRTRVLIRAVPYMSNDTLVEAYLQAVETIPSSGDQRRALNAMMDS